MLRARRGEGEVMGRSRLFASETFSAAIDDSPPKDVAGKEFKGTRLTGESGDEDGEGSDNEDESVHETVVVGEESADSEFWVDVLSWCL